ncbi:MAG: hypothetical protein ABJM36_01045 [Algibacter sp.]|uniref:hypothetical protein n=1 Tax=Algibacter sp. TaxID=1872428 RepID=UPI00329A21A4
MKTLLLFFVQIMEQQEVEEILAVYEGGHRVPGIISYPGKIKGAITNNTPVVTMDLLPTFVDLADGNLKNRALMMLI